MMKLRVSETKSAIDYLKGHPRFSEAVEVMKARTPHVFENQVTFKIRCIDEVQLKQGVNANRPSFEIVSYPSHTSESTSNYLNHISSQSWPLKGNIILWWVKYWSGP